MSTAWYPLWPSVEPAIRDAQPDRFRWPSPNPEGWIGPVHSPLREDRNPSFSVRPDSETDPGGWADHATGEHGSMADLAERLGIDPHVSVPDEPKARAPELTLSEFCRRRKVQPETLEHFEVSECEHKGRPALRFPTRLKVDRVKYLDGDKPKAGWVATGGRAHWYGLGPKRTGGEVLYIVNGEPSVWACSQSKVPAVCTCSGEGSRITDEMIDELRGTGFARVRVVFDRDDAGRKGAQDLVQRLRDAGLDAGALELPSHLRRGGDVDDLHRMVGDERLAERLAGLQGLQSETPALTVIDRLRTVADHDALEAVLRELKASVNGSDPIGFAVLRERAIAALRVAPVHVSSPAKTIDAALGTTSKDDPSAEAAQLVLADPEPYSEPVDGTELLDELVSTLRRFVVLPPGAAETLALWAAHAHAIEAASISPILAFVSPEKRCGKTLALELVAGLVPRPLPAASITAAALFRGVEKYAPTLLIDEGDTFLRDNDELRGVLNSGHRKRSALVLRCEGDDHEPVTFRTWCPKAIALIGGLPSTLEDRSIVVRMRRRAPGEQVERWRDDHARELTALCSRLARWVSDHRDALRAADPEVPGELNDRAADNWRPLLAIADTVGDEWCVRARKSAVALSTGEADSESPGVLLLHDLRALFEEHGDKLTTLEIIQSLVKMEERPWPEYRNGKPITAVSLAKLLKPFGVKPNKWREGAKDCRGYSAKDFEDALRRYTSSVPPSPPATPATTLKTKDLQNSPPATDSRFVAGAKSRKSNGINNVAGVAGRNPPVAGTPPPLEREPGSDDDLDDLVLQQRPAT